MEPPIQEEIEEDAASNVTYSVEELKSILKVAAEEADDRYKAMEFRYEELIAVLAQLQASQSSVQTPRAHTFEVPNPNEFRPAYAQDREGPDLRTYAERMGTAAKVCEDATRQAQQRATINSERAEARAATFNQNVGASVPRDPPAMGGPTGLKIPAPSYYNGSSKDLEGWLKEMETYLRIKGAYYSDVGVEYATFFFKDQAKSWWLYYDAAIGTGDEAPVESFEDLKPLMRSLFRPVFNKEREARDDILKIRQTGSVKDYIKRFQELC